MHRIPFGICGFLCPTMTQLLQLIIHTYSRQQLRRSPVKLTYAIVFLFKPTCRTCFYTTAAISFDVHFYPRYGLDTTRLQKAAQEYYISAGQPQFPRKYIKHDKCTTFLSVIKLDQQKYQQQNLPCSYLWHSQQVMVCAVYTSIKVKTYIPLVGCTTSIPNS